MKKSSVFKSWFRDWTRDDVINHVLLTLAIVLLVWSFFFAG